MDALKPAYETTIPLKLPGLNDYVKACRANKFEAAAMKSSVETAIGLFIRQLPRFERPVTIRFEWVEGNKRRDYDNVAFAKKFILDAMVKAGKLKDDNRNCITGFIDTFSYEPGAWSVKLTIIER